jgi:hypothetical protein
MLFLILTDASPVAAPEASRDKTNWVKSSGKGIFLLTTCILCRPALDIDLKVFKPL